MKKKLFSALLTSTMVLAAIPMSAFALEPVIAPKPVIAPTPIIAPLPEVILADVPANHWAESQAKRMVKEGYMLLDQENRFLPNQSVTRTQLVDALWRMSGKPVVNYQMKFEDVQEGSEMAEAIRWAAAEKIASGYGNGTFGANDLLTREQMATIVYQYVQKFDMGFKGMWMFPLQFEDAADISEFANEPVHWLVASHLMAGDGNKLMPKGTLNRAEEAVILSQLMDLAADKGISFSNYGG